MYIIITIIMKYISQGNLLTISLHFKYGTQGKLDSLGFKVDTIIYSLRTQHVTCGK